MESWVVDLVDADRLNVVFDGVLMVSRVSDSFCVVPFFSSRLCDAVGEGEADSDRLEARLPLRRAATRDCRGVVGGAGGGILTASSGSRAGDSGVGHSFRSTMLRSTLEQYEASWLAEPS